MTCRARYSLALLVGCIGSAGCGGAVSAGEPSISITSPAQLATVQPGSDSLMSVPVDFVVANFTLKDSCKGASNCGHVVLKVDLNGCITFGQKYNATASASPIQAHFSRCPIGSHSMQLELHHDDDTAELDANGQPVASQAINITLGTPDGGP
jgi:hypothetical protein